MERSPVLIPRRQGNNEEYVCPYCRYKTVHPNHIKCHMLVHEPPHWRCDVCSKRFIMLSVPRTCSTRDVITSPRLIFVFLLLQVQTAQACECGSRSPTSALHQPSDGRDVRR